MIISLGPIRKQIFGLDLSTLEFSEFGFNTLGKAKTRLERVAMTVVEGYNAAAELGLGRPLQERANMVSDELNGFFHEGMGMGLYALDIFSVIGGRFNRYVKGPARQHDYMAYIGAGLAIGLFRRDFRKALKTFDPLSGCLVLDGLGFYHAYFHPERTLRNGHFLPKTVAADKFFVDRFDSGAGRALWFYTAGDVKLAASLIGAYPKLRRPSLWAGVGLAATYACGVSQADLELLVELSGEYDCMLAQGSALASHARHRAGNPHANDFASRTLTGFDSALIHGICTELAVDLQGKSQFGGERSFSVWLNRLQEWIKANIKLNQVAQEVQAGNREMETFK